jgi:cysteine desulfurase / selenocysteine lyase
MEPLAALSGEYRRRVPIDIDRVRADTPGCSSVIHLNNAGSSLPPAPVVDRVVDHVHLEARIGGYEAKALVTDELTVVHRSFERLLGAETGSVALAASDTAAWTKALWGLAGGGWFDQGGRVLVDRANYNSHYLSLLQLRDRFGITIELVASLDDGSIDLADLDRLLDRAVRLVSATHVGTHRGLVNPVAEVGARTRRVGVPYFLDACQSTGQLPVDVSAIGCDVATGTGRKFLRGPRGTGFLYARQDWAERMSPPGIDGVSAEWLDADHYVLAEGARRFEEFETNCAALLGLGVAVEYALGIGIDAIAARVGELAEELRTRLVAVGADVHDGGTRRSGIVTFTLDGISPAEIQEAAARAGINVSVTDAPWARLDMEPRGLTAAVRASVHYFNVAEEVERLVEVVAGLR